MVHGDILIIDDVPAVLTTLEELLQKEGYTTRTVIDGPAALAALQAARPDLVLLDFHLIGMTGLQLLTAAQDRGLEMGPVVLMTAVTPVIFPRRLTGIVACVFKPFDTDLLLDCIARHICVGRSEK